MTSESRNDHASVGVVASVTVWTLSSRNEVSGTALSAEPIKKCPGINAVRSAGSSDSALKGLEFRQSSICVSSVAISSYANVAFPMILLKWCFVALTAASYRPPKCGADGGLKRHLTLLSASSRPMMWLSLLCAANILRSSASAPTKFVPQSL